MVRSIDSDLEFCRRTIESLLSNKKVRFGYLTDMVVCLEDRRFYNHPGFDLLSILRALFCFVILGRVGGASTIEHQLVRTITNNRERTIRRKIREISLAQRIRGVFSKDEILTAYLLTAYFGTGLNGCIQASKSIFRVPPNDLDIRSAAFLASMLLYPAPKKATADWYRRANTRAKYAILVARRISTSVGFGRWVVSLQKGSLVLARAFSDQFGLYPEFVK